MPTVALARYLSLGGTLFIVGTWVLLGNGLQGVLQLLHVRSPAKREVSA
jgi:hypothetical protein